MKSFRVISLAGGLMFCGIAAFLTTRQAVADPAPAATGAPTTQSLSDQFAKPGAAPDKPDESTTDADSGLALNFPAGWTKNVDTPPGEVMVTLTAPAIEGESNPGSISVRFHKPDPALGKTLEQIFKASTSADALPPDAKVYGPIKTKLAGDDALAYLTDVDLGPMKIRSVTVFALINDKELEVTLMIAPLLFDKNWDAYKRVVDSVKLTK